MTTVQTFSYRLAIWLGLICVAGGGALTASGQTTVFEEDFENLGPTPPGVDAPPELVSQGWIFRFQDGSNDAQWRRGTPASGDTGYSGWYYLQIYDLPDLGQPAAAWAILPEIPGLTAGQQFRMFQLTWTGMTLDHWELRWSPTGGTDTGNNWDDVGDFSVNISLDITNQPLFDFDIATASLPGNGGRLALRYVYDTWFGGSTPRAGVDLIQIFGSPAPPVPGPGETVHWTPDLSPITVTDQIEIPETATLVIDAGVEVVFNSATAVLLVHGTLRTDGTPTQPVRFTPGNGRTEDDGAVGLSNFQFSPVPAPLPPAVGIFTGLESRMRIGVSQAAVAVFRDCTFIASGTQPADPRPGITAYRASVSMQDTTFVHGWSELNDCLTRIDGCTFDDTQLVLYHEFTGNPVAITGSTFENVPDDAPILINGVNAWLSGDNLIQNNLYPVRIASGGGGIMPGSVLPTAGNTNNWIEVSGFEAGQSPGHVWRWADVGLPYVWGPPTGPGGLDSAAFIDPGVVMEVRGGETLGIISLRLRGRPEAPIVLRRHDPGQAWLGGHRVRR